MSAKQFAVLGWRFIAALTVLNYGLAILTSAFQIGHIDAMTAMRSLIGLGIGIVLYRFSHRLGEFMTRDLDAQPAEPSPSEDVEPAKTTS